MCYHCDTFSCQLTVILVSPEDNVLPLWHIQLTVVLVSPEENILPLWHIQLTVILVSPEDNVSHSLLIPSMVFVVNCSNYFFIYLCLFRTCPVYCPLVFVVVFCYVFVIDHLALFLQL